MASACSSTDHFLVHVSLLQGQKLYFEAAHVPSDIRQCSPKASIPVNFSYDKNESHYIAKQLPANLRLVNYFPERNDFVFKLSSMSTGIKKVHAKQVMDLCKGACVEKLKPSATNKPSEVNLQISTFDELQRPLRKHINEPNLYIVVDFADVIASQIYQKQDPEHPAWQLIENKFKEFVAFLKQADLRHKLILLTHCSKEHLPDILKKLESEHFHEAWFDDIEYVDEDQSKGAALKQFVSKQDSSPSHILFVDDTTENLKSMKQTFPDCSTTVQFMTGILGDLTYWAKRSGSSCLYKFLDDPDFPRAKSLHQQWLSYQQRQPTVTEV
ncbi:HAD family hydrolase [Parashewanella tropica]|uniref:HAD family hydrolase n=1 Tax=Parashewanella tropica TaxID=2547970 RepID=UPI0010598E9C|nr:DUF2608 domain-containing protein [Parashewanella tropica]